MLRKLMFAALLFMTQPASADIPEDVPGGLAMRGQVEFDFLERTFFVATLYTPEAVALDWQKPLALKLDYNRWFAGALLVYSSMFELNRMEGFKTDHNGIRKQLKTCFKTVQKGDTYLAIAQQPNAIEFRRNGTQTCVLEADKIAMRFLSIWLSDTSREPALAMALRGEYQG